MYHRPACPSMGLVRRSICQRVTAISDGSHRGFHGSARRFEDSNPTGPPKPAPRDTKATRAATAFQKLNTLSRSAARPGGLARGVFRTEQQVQSPSNTARPPPGTLARRTTPVGIMARRTGPPAGTMASGPPSGTMVKAPSTLRISRQPIDGSASLGRPRRPSGGDFQTNVDRPRGGRLAGRSTGRGGAKTESAPRRREAGAGKVEEDEVERVEDTLSDGMVQQLLRLQRKEWDRVPYEPKYAEGSKEAAELLELGKGLFADKVTVKKPTSLDITLGIQHMHGA